MDTSLACWLCRQHGIAEDNAEDLQQEAALAELCGQNPQTAAKRLARQIARHQKAEDIGLHAVAARQPTEDRQSAVDRLTVETPDAMAFALAVMTGELSRHDGTVSRRFSKFLQEARSILAVSVD